MPYLGKSLDLRNSNVARSASLVGDNSTTQFDMGFIAENEQSVIVSVDGVVQQDAGYTVSSNLIDFLVAPVNLAKIECRGLNEVGVTFTPQNNSVNFNKLSPGATVQTVRLEDGAVATGTTILPFDDSVPQSAEGDEYMTLQITPKLATSKLVIEVVTVLSHSAAGTDIVTVLFKDSDLNALAGIGQHQSATAKAVINKFVHDIDTGSINTVTFKVRSGGGQAGTTTFNGISAGRILGGKMSSSITIREIKQ